MAIFTLVRNPTTDWQSAVPGDMTITRAEWQKFDANIFAAINAVRGGCWAPLTKLTFTGMGFNVSGLTLVRGTGAYLKTWDPGGGSSLGEIILSDNDYPEYDPATRTRDILTPCGLAMGGHVVRTVLDEAVQLLWSRSDGAMQLIAHTVAPRNVELATALPVPGRFFVPMRAHDGATLSTVTVHYAVPTRHSVIAPVTMPKVRVLRVDEDGEFVAMTSEDAGADADGYVSVEQVTNGEEWGTGEARTLVVTCDQNNVVEVDTYQYVVEVVEEQGLTEAPWTAPLMAMVRAATTAAITLTAPQTIDGVACIAGNRVLVKDQVDNLENGVYEVAAGAWVRATDMFSAAAMAASFGIIIPVKEGDSQGGTCWQLKTEVDPTLSAVDLATVPVLFATKPSTDPDTVDDDGSMFRAGNIWRCVVAHYTAIADGRFQ